MDLFCFVNVLGSQPFQSFYGNKGAPPAPSEQVCACGEYATEEQEVLFQGSVLSSSSSSSQQRQRLPIRTVCCLDLMCDFEIKLIGTC